MKKLLSIIIVAFSICSGYSQEEIPNLDKENIKFIINTHHQTDHSHGNTALRKSATIIAHRNSQKRLLQMPKEAQPVVTFNVEKLVQVIPKDARIIPGHYGLSNLEELISTRDMLADTIGIVERKKSAGACTSKCAGEKTNNECTKFAISFDKSSRNVPTSGRVLLLLSRTEKFITDVNANGTPVFGINVDDLKPNEQAIIDETTLGNPIRSLKQIPAGDYYVKAYLNVYTTFHRSDGHIVKLHMDQGEGQRWRYSPGNLFSKTQKIHFDPDKKTTISIIMDRKIPPLPEHQDTEWVENIKIESELVSKFWGHPMYIGARVLLPKGFHEHPEARYPIIFEHGHFSTRNPGHFQPPEGDKPGNAFYEAWTSDDFPRMLLVTFQHANPYYDDSYAINSENVGPYGDAIIQEIIPVVEKKFRAIGKPYSRVLTGGSTGGWISLAQQVWYPDFYGGTWTFFPDQIDFHYYELVNLYEPKNAYFIEHEWTKVAIPASRQTDGMPRFRMDQENLKEEVEGTRYRSGGQWAIWNAVFAPVAEDGYPKPIWDPWTGIIDPDVAQWAREHYDITYYLKKNWKTVGPKIVGKINIFCGRMDNWWIEQAVYLFEKFITSTKDPHYPGRFEYGVIGGHGWDPWDEKSDVGGMYREMAEHIKRNAPSGEKTALWNY